ncbi:MAG: DegT/DnrJ/EryC1/StrS family aminotransferase [Candidatus Bathyarchaeota archaeon]|nr:DegT/DnrJ/EryC1/StrS family aminotransferase [Candidatus Bathyarchaeota archaeon]
MLAINGGEKVRVKEWPSWPVFDEREVKAVEDVVRSGYWGGGVGVSGPKETEFEERFSRSHGCKYGICVANGTIALHVALLAAGIGPGDEVIVPALTFWATGSAVLMAGATPVIVDVDPETYCMDAEAVEEAITDRTRAVIPVYNYGSAPDMDKLLKIFGEHGLALIEDCARGHGFVWRNKPAGSIGDMGCFSFQQGKFMTAGEGGIIITNNKTYADKCYAIKDCGRLREGGVAGEGIEPSEIINWYNYRMTQIQAAILLVQLERLEEQVKIRQKNQIYLDKRLREIEGVEPVKVDERLTKHQPWPYCFKYDPKCFNGVPRDKFLMALRAEGIPCGKPHPPLHIALHFPKWSEAYKRYIEAKMSFPVSEKAYYVEAVELPQYLFLGASEDMDDIAEAILKIKRHASELTPQ